MHDQISLQIAEGHTVEVLDEKSIKIELERNLICEDVVNAMNVVSHTAHIHQSEISNCNVAYIALQITKEVFEQRAFIYYLVEQC